MRRALIWLFTFFLAGPVSAANLNSGYSEMGQMTLELGDQTLELIIPYDIEEDMGFAEQEMIVGFHTIHTAAQLVNDDGDPFGTTVQVTLQKNGGAFSMLSAEVFDERGFDEPLAMGADGGKGALTSYTLEGDDLTAEVQGTFVRLTGYMSGEPKPASGEAPLSAVIKWKVTLPPLE